MDVAAVVLHRARVTRPKADHLAIATFHRVLPEALLRAYPYPEIAVTPAELGWHLAYFRERYTCLTLRDAHRRWKSGERPTRPFLAVTFDDGQVDNVEHAAPVLEQHGIPASFFLPVDAIEDRTPLWHDRLGFAVLALVAGGRRETLRDSLVAEGVGTTVADSASTAASVAALSKSLTPERQSSLVERLEHAAGDDATVPAWSGLMRWSDARDLVASGHEIGSHSMSHPLLPKCTDDHKRREVEESRRALIARLEAPIDSFCYPNGDTDPSIERLVASAGYERAVTTRWGTNPPDADPLTLRRCDMDARRVRRGPSATLSAPMLAWRISGLHPGVRGL
jgi:peptidoglycan/xylan/chitin deacetylase (PgdA/CDA1 family)